MKIQWIKLSKILLLLYLVYTNVYRQVLFPYPIISYLLLPAAVVCFLIPRPEVHLDPFLTGLALFFLYCFFSGLVLSRQTSFTLIACKNLAAAIVVFWLSYEYSTRDGNIDFVCTVLRVWALSYALMILLFGVGDRRISISENVNVNMIAQSMVFAIGFILYQFSGGRRSVLQIGCGIAEIILFLYIIAVTVSRMAILCSALLLLLWVLFFSRGDGRDAFLRKGLFVLAVTAAAICLFYFFKSRFAAQYAFILKRMSGLTNDRSSVKRWELIKEAIAVFSEHPLFGVGFNNFRFYSVYSTYSHCFYAEILVCTGVIGSLLILSPMLLLFINLFHKARRAADPDFRKQSAYLLLIYLVFLILISAQIYLYSMLLMFVLSAVNGGLYAESGSESPFPEPAGKA